MSQLLVLLPRGNGKSSRLAAIAVHHPWVPAGHLPCVAEAEERVAHLRARGPTPRAFTFRRHFPPPGEETAEAAEDDRRLCPSG